MKINFNIPFLKANGEEETQPKVDTKKMKLVGNQMVPEPVISDDGYVTLETITVGTVLRRILNAVREDDAKLPFDERAKRAKLARKVGDATAGSLKNYSVEELKTIQDQVASHGSTELVGQIDDLINGSAESAAA